MHKIRQWTWIPHFDFMTFKLFYVHLSGKESVCGLCLCFLLACEVGFYKPVAGDQQCGKCPLHSHSETRAALSCPCDANFYRSSTDPPASPCTSESSCLHIIKPRNLNSCFLDTIAQKSIWKHIQMSECQCIRYKWSN